MHTYIHTCIQELKEGRKEKRSEGIYVIAVFEFEHLESVRVQVYMNTQVCSIHISFYTYNE